MNRFILRIATLLLIPCLVFTSADLHAFTLSTNSRQPRALFQEQALCGAVELLIKPFQKSNEWIRRERGAMLIPSGGGMYPVGQSDFTTRELRDLEQNAISEGRAILMAPHEWNRAFGGTLQTYLKLQTAQSLFAALPVLHEWMQRLVAFLEQPSEIRLRGQSYRIELYKAPADRHFYATTGRSTKGFTVIDKSGDENVIRLYVTTLASLIHEMLEFVLFPQSSSIQRVQRHTLAVFAEAVADGVHEKEAYIPWRIIEQLDRMAEQPGETQSFQRDFDAAVLRLEDKFPSPSDLDVSVRLYGEHFAQRLQWLLNIMKMQKQKVRIRIHGDEGLTELKGVEGEPLPLRKAAAQNLQAALAALPQNEGGMISMGGPSAATKTTLAGLMSEAAEELGLGDSFKVIDLDQWMKPRVWRHAILKRVAGVSWRDMTRGLSRADRKLLPTREDWKKIPVGEDYLEEADFWYNDLILKELKAIRMFLKGRKAGFYTVTAPSGKSVDIQSGDTIMIVGKYANLPQFRRFYNASMLMTDEDTVALKQRYADRTEGWEEEWRQIGYDRVIYPSWVAHLHRVGPRVKHQIHLDPQPKMEMQASGIRGSIQKKLEQLHHTSLPVRVRTLYELGWDVPLETVEKKAVLDALSAMAESGPMVQRLIAALCREKIIDIGAGSVPSPLIKNILDKLNSLVELRAKMEKMSRMSEAQRWDRGWSSMRSAAESVEERLTMLIESADLLQDKSADEIAGPYLGPMTLQGVPVRIHRGDVVTGQAKWIKSESDLRGIDEPYIMIIQNAAEDQVELIIKAMKSEHLQGILCGYGGTMAYLWTRHNVTFNAITGIGEQFRLLNGQYIEMNASTGVINVLPGPPAVEKEKTAPATVPLPKPAKPVPEPKSVYGKGVIPGTARGLAIRITSRDDLLDIDREKPVIMLVGEPSWEDESIVSEGIRRGKIVGIIGAQSIRHLIPSLNSNIPTISNVRDESLKILEGERIRMYGDAGRIEFLDKPNSILDSLPWIQRLKVMQPNGYLLFTVFIASFWETLVYSQWGTSPAGVIWGIVGFAASHTIVKAFTKSLGPTPVRDFLENSRWGLFFMAPFMIRSEITYEEALFTSYTLHGICNYLKTPTIWHVESRRFALAA